MHRIMTSKIVYFCFVTSFVILQLCHNAELRGFVGNPTANFYPCNGSDIVFEIFESNQPPEDENKYHLSINLKKYEHGPSLTANSKIKMRFDSEANVTLISVPARVSSEGELAIRISFYKRHDNDVSMWVRGRRGKPVPDIIGLIIDDDDVCPGGFVKSYWDRFIRGDANSAVAKEKMAVDKYKCGKKIITHNELITNGVNTKPGDWPWHDAIYRIRVDRSAQAYICGGSIINSIIVLTAGHCVVENGVKINPERLYVVLGKYNLAGGDLASQEKSVFKITLHREFNISTLANDIALLKLGSEAIYTQYVQPICLWEQDDIQKSNIYRKNGIVVGWGFTQNDILSQQLMQGTMPVVSDLKCIRSNPTHFNKYLTDNTFCAGFRNGTSVCNGDSGGGLYISRKLDNKTVWFLRGIISLSVSKTNKNVCDPNNYVIFTDVAQYLNWIDAKVK